MGGLIVKPGARIGSYVFMREVGSGGMARVLLAKDPAGELVALKVLRKSRFKTGLVRFRREFRALSRIHHPNIVSKAPHLLPGIDLIQGPRTAKILKRKRGSA
jgi:serine/threonine protein kinase